jgi:hypothetical protein
VKTDDIIKLLKVCSTASGCSSCPLADSTDCAGEVSLLALDVINRQKAEIEKLRKENDELKDGYFQKRYEEVEHQELMGLREAWRKSTDQNMDLQLEIERLETENKEQDQAIINALHRMGQIRAEAIKEFAEMLKNQVIPQKRDGYTCDIVLKSTIDNLVKEKTEEHNEP